jgi:tetratricopeptide (TPR) repeat protein
MKYKYWIIILHFSFLVAYAGTENITGHLRMAYEAHNRGLYSLSNTQIEKYIKENSGADNLDYAYLLSAVNLLYLEDIEKSIERLAFIRKHFPESGIIKDATSYLILANLKKKDIDTALSLYSEYRGKFATDAFLENQIEQAAFSRAVSLFNEGLLAESKTLLDKFSAQFKKSGYLPEVFYYQGLIYYQENNFSKASDFFKQASSLSSLIENKDIRADLNLKLGDCFFNMREYTSAEHFYNKVVEEFPDTLYSVWAYYQQSLLEKSKGNLIKAEEILESVKGTGEYELNFKILNELASIQMLQEEWRDSEKYLREITESFPGYKNLPEVYLKLGFVNFNLSRFEDSIKYFKKTLNLPISEEIKERGYFGLGYTYYIKSLHEDSFETWNKLITEFPNSQFIHEILFFTGKKHYESKDYQGAEKYLKQLITEYPESTFYAVSYQMLVESLLKQEKLNEGLIACEDFFSSGHENETIRLLYGKILYLLKDFKKAQEVLEKTKSVNPAEMVEAIYYLGKIYGHKGQVEKAQEKFLEILSFYPEFKEWNKLAEKELKRLKK